MSILLSQAQSMAQSALFSSGTELASFMTSSVLLRKSWDVIKTRHKGIVSTMGEGLLSWNVYREPGSALTIIAFEYPGSKEAPLVAFNNTAISLLKENYRELREFISEITSSTRLIVTGLGFGGFVASVFTTLLSNSIPLRRNSTLCITFGSPLIGNKKLQQDLSNWNFCFFHVVSLEDPLPRLSLVNHSSETSAYMPSGTFLFCSDVNSTCFQNPESALEFLKAIGPIHVQNQGFQYADYGKILENLKRETIRKDLTTMPENMTRPLSNSIFENSVSLQLRSLGWIPHMQQQNVDINTLEKKMEELDRRFIHQRREKFAPHKKLVEIKIGMYELDWYRKLSQDQRTGYYDNYKNLMHPCDNDVNETCKNLTSYWENMVEEAKMKPQKEGIAFRTRWVYAVTNYRRMVEPLVIALYYRNGGKDYMNENRPKHFVVLEEWLNNMTQSETRNEEYSLDWDRYWDEDCDVDEDGYWDEDCYGHKTVDDCLVSSKGSIVDEEEWNMEDKLNSYIRSDDENFQQAIFSPRPSTTRSKNNEEKCVNVPIMDKILRTRKRNVEGILTIDSCFWAHVEEACISCKALKVWLLVEEIRVSCKELPVLVIKEKEKTLKKLVEFEEYVYELLKSYEVSPDIFFEKSSYMHWWNEYKAIKGTSYDSKLASFMNDIRNYKQYALGDYDFL